MIDLIVVFDLDGTLVDSFEVHYLGFREILREFGIELKKEKLEKLFGLDVEKIIRIIFKENKKKIEKSEVRRIISKKKKLTKKYSNLLKFSPGIKEMLDYLKGLGVKLAIFSNSMEEDVEEILDMVGIKKYFDIIITASDVRNKKPNPEGILKIMEISGEKKENIIYVGDKKIDEETARNAGVKFYHISEFIKKYRYLIRRSP